MCESAFKKLVSASENGESMNTHQPDAETHYSCRKIVAERDTYREMCVELLETTMKLRFISGRTTTAIDESITKAEKLLGGLK